jgi:hypothetical protein
LFICNRESVAEKFFLIVACKIDPKMQILLHLVTLK